MNRARRGWPSGWKCGAKKSLAIAVTTRYRMARGSAARITAGSMKLWWLAANTTGPPTAARCSRPWTRVHANSRVSGSSPSPRHALRIPRTISLWFQRGKGNGGSRVRDDAAGEATSASRSATVAAPDTAPSSTVASSSFSSTISSSTRSSEVRPSSSSRVSRLRVPPATRSRIDTTVRSPVSVFAVTWTAPCSAHVLTTPRLSFCVPSVRGSRSPGQTSTSRSR